jgi:hypothetical protein
MAHDSDGAVDEQIEGRSLHATSHAPRRDLKRKLSETERGSILVSPWHKGRTHNWRNVRRDKMGRPGHTQAEMCGRGA